MKTLFLFPDTNVLLQCKPLEQVDWSALGSWDRIELLLTRPVQTEIDGLKGGGNARRAQRARAASTRIRELLQAPGLQQAIRKDGPVVLLVLRHDLRRDESVATQLDYTERDDQLIGIALGFQKTDPAGDVWLLTNDTGPMASAVAVGLTYRTIPDAWMLPPEMDESEKREAALKAELARFKSLEPSFTIGFVPPPGSEPLKAYRDLTAQEIEELMAELSARYPACTDFGPTELLERTPKQSEIALLFAETKEVFHPAKPDEVAAYRKGYADWQQACRRWLEGLAKTLNHLTVWPKLTLCIENAGTRPAEDALVTIEVQGDLCVRCPDKADDEGRRERQKRLELPLPPEPPAGRWIVEDRYGFGRLMADMVDMSQRWPLELKRPELPSIGGFKRDPNTLYFKVGARGIPSRRIDFECAQWRHSHAPERFELQVLCPMESKTHAGLLRVEVHAANLTRPANAQLPLTVAMEDASCYEIAMKMVTGAA